MTRAGTLPHVRHDIDRILIDQHRIAERVESLAGEINDDLAGLSDDSEIVRSRRRSASRWCVLPGNTACS